MGLRLHNTLTRTKDDFVPIDPANVRMYVCGPTVYDFAHIGNARPLIVFDVLFRLLRHLYGPDHVTYVRNITDVDDKINARAAEECPALPLNEAIRRVTEKTEAQYHDDAAALGCLPPTVEPRATEHIDEMKAMIETLIAKGYAYVAEHNVLFHVAAMEDYGRLSNRSLDDMIAGARVEVAPYKRDPMDFVLWKPSKPGEPSWPSPAGINAAGRPGWHLECSAMSDRWLWEEAKPSLSDAGLARPHQFDIHGGGVDLMFPHHENEVAQSRCAHGTPAMANYWLHNGFLQVEGEKMSKSLGNFVTVRELVDTWPGEAIRLNMLRSHYRQPMDWTDAGMREALHTLDQWYEAIGDVEPGMLCADGVDALSDDLNTPKAFAVMHQLRDEAASGPAGAKACLKATGQMLGLLGETASEWTARRRSGAQADQGRIDDMIAARAEARRRRDFAEADRIRGELDAIGIALMDSRDTKTGELVTTWEVKR
jgi:cysteinyl-tRNA synthetase